MGVARADAGTLVLLIHGAGTTGAVWQGVAAELGRVGGVGVLAPDLPGHGAASGAPPYSVGQMATAVATQIPTGRRVLVAGHSLGGYVALELASGRYGFAPVGAVSLGAKIEFTTGERTRLDELAARPVRWFGTRAEALARYRLVSGLDAGRFADDRFFERAVAPGPRGFRLACDPATYALIVPPFGQLLAAATCPVLVARGSGDALVSRAQCEALGVPFEELAGLGHNVQVEDPPRVAALLCRLLAEHPDDRLAGGT